MIKASDMKPGRVKVGIRCRPAFQDEIDFAKGEFLSIVDIKPDDAKQSSLGQISLTLITGKQRDFTFDYAFDATATQDQVYDRVARPVVTDVLKGFNGTIFAYGQTGTGKTYTMGILEFVNNEHAGIIPRAISQVFEYVEAQESTEVSVSLSFLQLYRETIQDLLSPGANVGDDNLLIREDPQRGFFVEGLQEFAVRNYREAEALINLGLENRAIAPTLMNTTSSRSHTVLTINLQQRITGDGKNSLSKTVRSKLLMVDLAGSERVRRTVSKGTRLSEAKSINTSLSALGNVIAALAEQNTSHVPYRDSKLTRLLQDSLGGTASTALIATVGPAAVNYGETLSTLLFASRCMAVKITPIQHEEVDYAEMCAKLQAQLNAMEGVMNERLAEQQERHERVVQELHESLTQEKNSALQQKFNAAMETTAAARASFDAELNSVLDRLEAARNSHLQQNWLGKETGWLASSEDMRKPDAKLVTLLGYSFEVIAYMSSVLKELMQNNLDRDEKLKNETEQQYLVTKQNEVERENEMLSMEKEDPRNKPRSSSSSSNNDEDGEEGASDFTEGGKIGSHLAPMTKLQALIQVEGKYLSNNDPVNQFDSLMVSGVAESVAPRPSIHQYNSADEIAVALASMHSSIRSNAAALNAILVRKDEHFKRVKSDLVEQMVEKRNREEEVINWSYILKYLLASSSKLRKQLQREKKIQAAWEQAAGGGGGGATALSSSLGPLRSALNGMRVTEPDNMSLSTVGHLFDRTLAGIKQQQQRETEEGTEADDIEDQEMERLAAAAVVGGSGPLSQSVPSTPYAAPPVIEVPRSSALPGFRPEYDMMSEMTMSPNAGPTTRKADPSVGPAVKGGGSGKINGPLSEQPLNAVPGRPPFGATAAPIPVIQRQPQLKVEMLQGHRSSTPSAAAAAASPSSAGPPMAAVEFDSYAYSVDESDLSVTTTSPSVVSGPSGYQRNNASSAYSRQAQDAYLQTNYGNSYRNSNTIRQPINRSETSKPSSRSASPLALRGSSGAPPSAYAKEVVSGLGVDGHQAVVAMSIVDKVSQITPDQMKLLDPETRAQILQIRKELGLESGAPPASSSSSRRSVSPSPLSMASQDRSLRSSSNSRGQLRQSPPGVGVRSSSAPRSRSASGGGGGGASGPSDSPPLKTVHGGGAGTVGLTSWQPSVSLDELEAMHRERQRQQNQQLQEIQRKQLALLADESPRKGYPMPTLPSRSQQQQALSYDELQQSPAGASRRSYQSYNESHEAAAEEEREGGSERRRYHRSSSSSRRHRSSSSDRHSRDSSRRHHRDRDTSEDQPDEEGVSVTRSEGSGGSRRRRHYPGNDYSEAGSDVPMVETSSSGRYYPPRSSSEPVFGRPPISGREHLYATRDAATRREQAVLEQQAAPRPASQSPYLTSAQRSQQLQQIQQLQQQGGMRQPLSSLKFVPLEGDDKSDDEFSQIDI